jgi:modulator of FtsH protease HflK
MAWNQPGEDKKRPAPRGTPDNSPLDELLRRLQRQVQRLWRPGGGRATAAITLALLMAAVWFSSGYYQIGATERGVVQRFGRYITTEQPGHGWHLPWPVESVTKVDVATLDGVNSKALMLTSEQSLIDISWSIQYRIADPQQFLFQVREPEASVRQVSETVIRELVGGSTLSTLVDGAARARITAEARQRIQTTLDGYGAGIALTSVNLIDVQLPDAVMASQRDAAKAAEDRQRAISDADGYAGDILPKAQIAAQKQLTDAQVYATQTVASAEAETQRFAQVAQAFARAPEITRSRMYTDTIEGILAHAHKIIIDTKSGSGNTIYIPLDKLAEAIRATAPPPAPATAAAAPAPATAAVPSTPRAVDAGDADDAHSRDRPER